jgi:predicted permease
MSGGETPASGSDRSKHEAEAGDWRRARTDEIRAELEDHVARRARFLELSGLSPAEAHAEAKRRLGDVSRIEEDLMRIAEQRRRRMALVRWLDDGVRDVKLAVRSFVRRPVLALGVVLTVGLAAGAFASVFSIVNGVLLRPLSFPQADHLYSVYTRYLPETGYDFPYFSVSGPEYEDYAAMTRAMSGVGLYYTGLANLTPERGEPERLSFVSSTWNLFEVLGVKPVLGRGFGPAEDDPGRACVAVLSDGLWRERFGGETNAIGREIRLDGEPCQVIGVMPAGFWFPTEQVRLWTTLELNMSGAARGTRSAALWNRQNHPWSAVARLSPNATLEAAHSELDVLHARWSAEYPDHYAKGHFIVLQPLHEDVIRGAGTALLVLLVAVGTVFLIVCVNLAGLLLSSAESRRKEFAVRSALGVRRGRLVRQLLTESLLLALAGGALGLVASPWMLRGILALYPGGVPRASEIGINSAVVLFTGIAAMLAGAFFGLAPALQTSSVRASETLRATGRGLTAHKAGIRIRRAFVVAQIALALILVIASSLLARSYARLRAVDLGFDPHSTLAFAVNIPEGSYPDAEQARNYFLRLEERLGHVQGVVSAGAVSNLPLISAGGADDFKIEGKPLPAPGQQGLNARYQMATPTALNALGLRLRTGRWFSETDTKDAPLVAVINESTARTYFAGEDPVGKRIAWFGPDSAWVTIIGVIADVHSQGAASEAPPAIYTALAQAPRPFYAGRNMNVVVRYRGSLAAMVDAVRGAATAIDPAIPVSQIRTLDTIVKESLGEPLFTSTLMSAFAVLALTLGTLGVYSVLAQLVQARTREIGIRLTLGATRQEVMRMVLMNGLVLGLVGTGLGIVAAVALRGSINALLFGVAGLDGTTLLTGVAVLLGITTLASSIPALRAIRVDPAVALRAE